VRLSVIIPAFNAERHLAATLESVAEHLGRSEPSSELIVVDDGSADATRRVAERLRGALEVPLTVLGDGRNRGKGWAVRHGFATARGQHVVFTDADLSYPADNIAGVTVALAGGADIAIGSRAHPDSVTVASTRVLNRVIARHGVGRAFNALARATLLPGVGDTQAGLKGLRRTAVERLLPLLTLDRFAFDVELLVAARRLGLTVVDVPVRFEHPAEPSQLRLGRAGAGMVVDLARVWARRRRGRYDP
jgi:glycosyltransferase involved in cell wall biosynthesis